MLGNCKLLSRVRLPFNWLFNLMIALLLGSCSTAGPELSSDSRYEKIVILGTNDIHGALIAQNAKSRQDPPGTAPTEYSYGGMMTLASHIRGLQKEYGTRLVWLDGGDQFQGTLESNMEEGRSMVKLFNELGLDASAIGNHEFDFGPPGPFGRKGDPIGALKKRISEAKYPYLAANISSKKGAPIQWPNTRATTLIQAGRLKVGVIGLSTLDTPTTTRPEFVKALRFKPLSQAVSKQAAQLRRQGVDLIVLAAHVGLHCQRDPSKYNLMLSVDSPEARCRGKGELVDLLRSLPAGTVDAVVSGHSHTVIHHFIGPGEARVPVIQAGTRAQVFNLIHLTYDLEKKKLVSDQTRIQGPIPVCPKVFSKLGHCDGSLAPPPGGRGALVQAPGLAKTDPKVAAILKPVFEKSEKLKATVIGHAARPVEHQRFGESALGNLVADALKRELHADVAVMNSGGIRAPLEPGPITYGALFKVLPFDNFPAKLEVTGRQLKLFLRIAESGARGFFPVSGLRLVLLPHDRKAPHDDLDHNGKIEPWEFNRIVSATFSDGSRIDDRKTYTVATVDFLAEGGDDLEWLMSQIPAEKKNKMAGPLLRDLVQSSIEHEWKSGNPINTKAKPLIVEGEPRIVVQPAGDVHPPAPGKPRYLKF